MVFPQGRWSMSRKERKLARRWQSTADVRAEHKRKLINLTEAEQECLRQKLLGDYKDDIERKLREWKKSGYDAGRKELHDQFNVKSGWFWQYRRRDQDKWNFIFAGELRAVTQRQPPPEAATTVIADTESLGA